MEDSKKMTMSQIFQRILSKPKTPEEIQKELQEEMLAQEMGISTEYAEVQDPKWSAQVNFENFKACFKRDPMITAGGEKGYISADKYKVSRLREFDSQGSVTKSLDSLRIEDNFHNRSYMGMINRAYGVKAVVEDGYIHMTYDIEQIEKDRARKVKKR